MNYLVDLDYRATTINDALAEIDNGLKVLEF